MKKIAIITIYDLNNYGNRLQNYAVQKILSKRYRVQTIKSFYNYTESFNFRTIKYKIKKIIKFLFHLKASNERKKNFFLFDLQINKTRYLYKYYDLRKLNLMYDYFVVGSDQIWNFSLFPTNPFFSFLGFSDYNKSIAFAPSMCLSELTDEQIQTIKKYVSKFKAVSSREEKTSKIISNIIQKDVQTIIDPTLVLSVNEWRKVSKKPRGAKAGYILTYFLSPKCEDAKLKLEEIRGEKEVYELLNPDDQVSGTAGPSEFLWLFDHADMILTDSFHACVFSFLFNKPFIVYDRNWDGVNMNSRIETFLSKFQLKRKYVNSGLPNDIWEHDYTEGYKQLEIERKKSIDFLKKALED